MRMPELKSLTRECRLRGYSELVALLQNSPSPGQNHTSTSPTPLTQTWDDRRPRKASPKVDQKLSSIISYHFK